MTPPPLYTLALEEARRGLDLQLADLKRVRDRGVALVSIGGLIGTFVGGLGAIGQDPKMTPALWVAILAFAGLTVCTLVILWPREMHSTQDPQKLIKWADDGHEPGAMQKKLASSIGEKFDQNDTKITHLQTWVSAAVVLLAVEFVALAVQLVRSA